jgi:hypothetical protein
MLRTAAVAIAVVASLASAASALAKPVAYKGVSSRGYEITFVKSGKTVKNVRGMIPATCVPTVGGGPAARGGTELFDPPGRLPLGREVTVSAVTQPAMHYSKVTKNYRFSARKRAGGVITGRLHVNFSFNTVGYTYSYTLVGWVCQGDATFRARPAGRG